MRLTPKRPMHLALAFIAFAAFAPRAFAQGSITSEPLAPPSGVTSRPLAPLTRSAPSPALAIPTPLAPVEPVAPLAPTPPQATIAPRMDPPMAMIPPSAPYARQDPTGSQSGSRAPSLLGHSAPGQASIDTQQAPPPYRPAPRVVSAPAPPVRPQRLAPVAPSAPFSSTTRSPLPGNLANEARRPASTARDLAPP